MDVFASFLIAEESIHLSSSKHGDSSRFLLDSLYRLRKFSILRWLRFFFITNEFCIFPMSFLCL